MKYIVLSGLELSRINSWSEKINSLTILMQKDKSYKNEYNLSQIITDCKAIINNAELLLKAVKQDR